MNFIHIFLRTKDYDEDEKSSPANRSDSVNDNASGITTAAGATQATSYDLAPPSAVTDAAALFAIKSPLNSSSSAFTIASPADLHLNHSHRDRGQQHNKIGSRSVSNIAGGLDGVSRSNSMSSHKSLGCIETLRKNALMANLERQRQDHRRASSISGAGSLLESGAKLSPASTKPPHNSIPGVRQLNRKPVGYCECCKQRFDNLKQVNQF